MRLHLKWPVKVFRVLLIAFIVLLCPYSIFEDVTKNVYNCIQISRLGYFLKSSALYILVQNAFIPEKSMSPNCDFVDADHDIDLPTYEFIRSLIRSSRSSVSHAKLSFFGSGGSSSIHQEARMSMLLAVKHQAAGNHEMALKLLKHAAELDPRDSEILNLLGEAFEKAWADLNFNMIKSDIIDIDKHVETLTPLQKDDILSAESYYTKALIRDPANIRATSNRQRTCPIVEKIDQKRFQDIDLKIARFFLVPETHVGLKRMKIEHYFQHIYHSNAIEGNTLSLAQTRAILETRLAIGGKSLQEQNEVLGLDAAMKYMNNTLLSGSYSTITLTDVLELHRRVLSFVDLSEAGRLRKTQVFVGDHTPPPANMVLGLMNELVDWVNSEEAAALHPIELAALTHWKLVYIHPFYDGNGRTARLVMNLILMRAGYPPVIIRKEDRHVYYETLKNANAGDVRPFIRFIAECTEAVVDSYLQAALGTTKTELGKRIIMPGDQNLLSQVGSTIQYSAPLRFPWLPHDQPQQYQPRPQSVIYST